MSNAEVIHCGVTKEEYERMQRDCSLRAFLASFKRDPSNPSLGQFRMDMPIESSIVKGEHGEMVVFWQDELQDE